MLRRALGFEERTLPRILQIQASLADKLLIATASQGMTYGEAPLIAAGMASFLIEAGLRPGDRVVCLLSNRMELIELWFGLSWAGAVLVPVNTAFRGPQLAHIVQTAKPKFIVAEAEKLHLLKAVPNAVAGAAAIFLVDSGKGADDRSIGSVAILPLARKKVWIEPRAVSPADPAAILFTSGTTGPGKGVICPHAQFYWWGVLSGESLAVTAEDVLFTTLPMFHTNALNALWQAMLAGSTYSFESRFSASQFWEQAIQRRATITYLLGAIVHILLKQHPSPLDRQHRIRTALSPATPAELGNEFNKRFGINLLEGYGSTETNFILSNAFGRSSPGTMGHVQDGFEVRIVDENDCDVPDGEAGEMLVRSHEPFSMASGYFGDDDATAKAWRDRWFHTGDRVSRDAEGVYRFVDRIKDSIRRRGENISSWEVENALMSHPEVVNAAVIGVASEMTEEEVMAFVEFRGNIRPEPEELVRYLDGRLAYFAIPRFWDFVTELPMTENGKVKKHLLKARGVTSTTWDRERAGVKLNRGSEK
jgi:crotonobetaine/carnitine-CoA ligase